MAATTSSSWTPPHSASPSCRTRPVTWQASARNDHRCRQPAAGLCPPGQPGLEPYLVLPVRHATGRARQVSSIAACLRHRPRQDRPIAHRHRCLGAHGGAARARRHDGRRQLHRHLDHRLDLHRPHRGACRRWRQDPPSFRQSLAGPGLPAPARKCWTRKTPGPKATGSLTHGQPRCDTKGTSTSLSH
jgi:hypothetical protein